LRVRGTRRVDPATPNRASCDSRRGTDSAISPWGSATPQRSQSRSLRAAPLGVAPSLAGDPHSAQTWHRTTGTPFRRWFCRRSGLYQVWGRHPSGPPRAVALSGTSQRVPRWRCGPRQPTARAAACANRGTWATTMWVGWATPGRRQTAEPRVTACRITDWPARPRRTR